MTTHGVSCLQRLETRTMLLLYAEEMFGAFVSKFGPTSCTAVLSSGRTAVTQNHITTSFDVQPKTQEASGYDTYTSGLSIKPLGFPFLQLLLQFKFFFPFLQITLPCCLSTTHSVFSNRTTARKERLNFWFLQLVAQLIGKLGHDVMHPDILFFL